MAVGLSAHNTNSWAASAEWDRGRGGRAAAWLASQPLDVLTDVRCVPWRGSARPGVLYTEHLGDGWYAGYACLGWN